MTSLLSNLNYPAIFFLMLLESTVVPVPSELVVSPAAYHAAGGNLNIWLIILFSTLGADCGATINYVVARYLGRPVIYRASDEGSTGDHAGHCFVIAGYDTATGLFRVNWGWGDAAVWADMSDINGLHTQLGSTYYQYSAGQGAFINVMPPADSIKVELPDPSYLAINNVEDMASISAIYPQPASQQVTIPYALTGNSDEQMEIYNVEGKLMTSLRVSAANNKATVSVKGFPAGIYTCRLKGASRKFIVK